MPSDVAISVKNLTKTYRIFGHPGDRIKQALTLGKMRFHKEYTALQNVSFEIKKGETIGIIGRNGSGKSTLLQLICGILKPTSGEIQVNGRVSALLELGAGFNPEFTGRENVYFQGTIMGIPKEEMENRFDDIAAFADIGEFIDQPVRTYSSGMFVRLAFATAVHASPDILIVDEALAVGDELFQRKCFEHIRYLHKQGCTIVYVSHNLTSIVDLCSHALLLKCGQLVARDAPKQVIARYLSNPNQLDNQVAARDDLCTVGLRRLSNPNQLDNQVAAVYNNPIRPYVPAEKSDINMFDPTLIPESTIEYPTIGAQIINPRILSLDGKCVNLLQSGKEYIYAYEVAFKDCASKVRCGMMIKTTSGYELGGLISHPAGEGMSIEGNTLNSQRFRFRCNLLAGTYFTNAGVTSQQAGYEERYLHRILDAVVFKVMPQAAAVGAGIVDILPASEG